MSSGGGYPYQRIVEELRAEILGGQGPPGSRMPSEGACDCEGRPVEVQDPVAAAGRHE